jgi:hypothetical protein
MATKYVVEHQTLCDGWINTWSVDDEPEVFNSYEEAERALDWFLKEEKKAFKRGEIDNMYEADEFRITEIKEEMND